MKAFVASFVFVLACATTPTQNDAGTGCPAMTPAAGTSCNPLGATSSMLCEYRTSDSCIMQASCDNQLFQWRVALLPGCTPNPSVCPATFADVPVGTSCTLPTSYLCAYGEGNCACETCAGDAGSTQVWQCNTWASAGALCPTPRALAGAPCSDEGVTCDYSRCCDPPALGPPLQCASGVWVESPNAACKCAPSHCP